MNASAIAAARAAAIATTLDHIRGIEARHGITRAALAHITAALVALGNQAPLFPPMHFPLSEAGARRFLLSEDADHRFALSLNVLRPGMRSDPHEHTTWVAIAAVEGQERNRLYTRAKDGLRLDQEIIVAPGHGLALMPEDIHAIETLGEGPARHLHLYGRALELLPDRRAFDPRTGAARPHQ